MNENTGFDTPDVYGALWIGALMLASGSIKSVPCRARGGRGEVLRAVPTDHEGIGSAPPRRRSRRSAAFEVAASVRIEDVAIATAVARWLQWSR